MYSKILTINEIYSDNIGDQAIADAMLLALNNKADIIERADYSFGTDISYLLNIKVMERLRFIKTLIPSNLKKMITTIKVFQIGRINEFSLKLNLIDDDEKLYKLKSTGYRHF